MKKIMLAAAIVCAAAISQAAQVTWTAKDIVQSGTSTSYYAILVDVSDSTLTTADAVANALKGGKFDGTVMWQGAATWVAKSSTVALGATKQELPASYGNGDSVTYMSIVFDAADAASAANYLATSGATAAEDAISDAGLLALTQGTQAGKTWTALSSSPVPEPTSGLLLLVGGALLGLRRRRA